MKLKNTSSSFFKNSFLTKALLLAAIVLITTMFLAAFSGCSRFGSPTEAQTAEAGAILLIEGMGKSEEFNSDGLLKEFESIEIDADTIDSENEEETRQVKGILLDDILEKYFGMTLANASSVKLESSDGYAIEVPSSILEASGIILAFEIEGENLVKNYGTFRSVIPGERSMYWVKDLSKIVLIEKREIKDISSVIFLDTYLKNLPHEEYEYYDSMDSAVKASDLLMDYGKDDFQDFIIIRSSDGLEKTEDIEIFRSAYFKIDGEDSPAFLSPDLPKGMWVKDIMVILYGQTAYFSALEASDVMENIKLEEKSRISMENIFKETGLIEVPNYLIRANDGYIIEISREDIVEGLLHFDSDQNLNIYFKNLPEKYSVKNLLSIELVK